MPVCIPSSRSARPPPALFEVFVGLTINGTIPALRVDFSAKIQLCLIDCITCCWQCLENFTWCKNMERTTNKQTKNALSWSPAATLILKGVCCHGGWVSTGNCWCIWVWACSVKLVLTCPKLQWRSVRTPGTMSSILSYQSLLQSLAQWHLFCCYYISKAFPPSLTISMTH